MSKSNGLLLVDQLRDGLREYALSLTGGVRFPSENAICRRFGVSRDTAGRAIKALVGEGVLSRRRGSGTFTVGRTPETIYFVMPCGNAGAAAGTTPILEIYSAALATALRHRIPLEIIPASHSNFPTEVESERLQALPRRSRIILPGYWFRNLFDEIGACDHRVVFWNRQSVLARPYAELLNSWHQLECDVEGAVTARVAALLKSGRKVALLSHSPHCRDPIPAGFRAGYAAAGRPVPEELLIFAANSGERAAYGFDTLMKLRREYFFDALLIESAEQAVGIADYLQRNRPLQPDELDLTVLFDLPMLARLTLPLTVLRFPERELGERAVAPFLNPSWQPGRERIPGTFVKLGARET